MRGIILVTLMGLLPCGIAEAQTVTDVQTVQGACEAQSALTVDGSKKNYTCDSAIVIFYDNQASHIMIQFGKKGDDSVPILGFAGTMADGVTLDVDRIYLEPGKPEPAEQSGCKLSFTPPHMTGIVCTGQVGQGAQKTALEIDFKAASGQ